MSRDTTDGDIGAALALLGNRGPDARRSQTIELPTFVCRLGHTRLSIVDLSDDGTQPMGGEDDEVVMVFNGEIYNSPELRRYCEAHGHRFRSSMDGEVIVHLWEMEGVAALRRLNGIFAVAIVDKRTGEVVLARDPIGVKPLFFSTDQHGSLWFGSEVSALRAAGAPSGSPDPVALAQFLTFLWIPDPRTPLSGIRTVEPGHAVRWRDGLITSSPYGDPLTPVSDADAMSSATAVSEARERFSEAEQRQLLADVPIALMASGGVDSGLIWWATRESLAHAYTITWSTDDGENLGDDVAAVRDLEARFGTPVSYLRGESSQSVLPPSGDLFADPAYDLTRLIARTAHEAGFKVLLSGQGGDELFAGYRRHTVAPAVEHLRLGRAGKSFERLLRQVSGSGLRYEYLARLARATTEPDPFRGYMQLCSYSNATQRAEALGCTEAEVSNDVVWQRHREIFESLPKESSFLRRVMALDLAVYLPGLGLSYVDRAGMEFGVEIRVPWLDLELVRWSLTLPNNVLRQWGRGKWVTRELAAIELGRTIAQRPKRAFAAPAGVVDTPSSDAGADGYRQGAYFRRAKGLLDTYLATSLT